VYFHSTKIDITSPDESVNADRESAFYHGSRRRQAPVFAPGRRWLFARGDGRDNTKPFRAIVPRAEHYQIPSILEFICQTRSIAGQQKAAAGQHIVHAGIGSVRALYVKNIDVDLADAYSEASSGPSPAAARHNWREEARRWGHPAIPLLQRLPTRRQEHPDSNAAVEPPPCFRDIPPARPGTAIPFSGMFPPPGARDERVADIDFLEQPIDCVDKKWIGRRNPASRGRKLWVPNSPTKPISTLQNSSTERAQAGSRPKPVRISTTLPVLRSRRKGYRCDRRTPRTSQSRSPPCITVSRGLSTNRPPCAEGIVQDPIERQKGRCGVKKNR
jgi:hypothetical protein